jgi:hypothetical protein
MRDDEFATKARASLRRLAKDGGFITDHLLNDEVLSLNRNGETHCVVIERDLGVAELPKGSVTVLGWGSLPMAFARSLHPDVTYFDLRFGIHSRELSSFDVELKNSLERQGFKFTGFTAEDSRHEGGVDSSRSHGVTGFLHRRRAPQL